MGQFHFCFGRQQEYILYLWLANYFSLGSSPEVNTFILIADSEHYFGIICIVNWLQSLSFILVLLRNRHAIVTAQLNLNLSWS